jgi:hypothetical protein
MQKLGTRQGRREAKAMTTPRAALHVAGEPRGGGNGEVSDLARDADPLRRLEAELQRASGGERPDADRLYEQAWGLLEEAWGLVTECLVLRDGLLDACHEIEQTMEGIQSRLGTLPATSESSVEERLRIGGQSTVNGSDGAAFP